MNEKLRFVFHERLARYLLVGRERDFKALALRHLAGALKREGDFFYFSPENLADLEKVLSELRSLFSREFEEAPLPFTLVPERSEVFWLRPGKLYVSPSLKKELEKVISKLDFLVRIDSWEGLWEISLPSTALPDLLFKARDLLWVGNKKPCFYCGLPWHRHVDCPGLKEVVSGKALKDYFFHPLKDLGEKLTHKIVNKDLGARELAGLYTRYFYFIPSFLRVLYYKVRDWPHFSQVRLGQEIPTEGGHLLIGLESLQAKRLEEAEKRFLAAGTPSNYRIALGLFHLSVLKEDYAQAWYFLEEANLKDVPPLVEATFALFKGRLAEIQKDYVAAERFYAEALRKDHSLIPAHYHRLLISFYLGGTERNLSRLSILWGHPLVFTLSFLEPLCLPIQKSLEKGLLLKLEKKQGEALAKLREAEDAFHRLKGLFSQEEVLSLEDRFSSLRETIYQGVFFELERAALEATELSLELQGYTYKKIRELKGKSRDLLTRHQGLKNYWHSYPYKHGETIFAQKLKTVGDRLLRLEQRLGRDPVKEFRTLLKEVENLAREIDWLEEERNRLEAKKIFRKQLTAFLAVFLLGEAILFVLYFTLPSFVRSLAPELLLYLPLNLSSFVAWSFLIFLLAFFWALFRR